MDYHDGEIRSNYYSVLAPNEVGDQIALGRARLTQLAERVGELLEPACREHEQQLASHDEAPRVGSWNGKTVLKVRGCRRYRALAGPLIGEDAMRHWGATPKRLA